MTRPRQVSVIGSGRADPELDRLAEQVGSELAAAGATVVCGGLGGVMEAVARGATAAGGIAIGIVPGEDASAASPFCTHVVATGIGHARNLAVVASGDAVIAIGGEWGTLAEIGFARKLGRAVVALRGWELTPPSPTDGAVIEVADDPRHAVRAALAAARASHRSR